MHSLFAYGSSMRLTCAVLTLTLGKMCGAMHVVHEAVNSVWPASTWPAISRICNSKDLLALSYLTTVTAQIAPSVGARR